MEMTKELGNSVEEQWTYGNMELSFCRTVEKGTIICETVVWLNNHTVEQLNSGI